MAVYEFVVEMTDKVSGPAKAATQPVIGLSKEVKGLNGYLDQNGKLHDNVTGKFKALGDAMVQPKSNAEALSAQMAMLSGGMSYAAEAVGAVVAALGAAVVAGAAFAIEASEAKMKTIALFNAMGEGKISGEQVDDMLDDMRTRLGITKDAMVPFTTQIMKMGITSQDTIEKMTEASLSAKALAGGADSGANAFLKLTEKVKLASDSGQKLKIPAKALAGQFAEMGLNIDDVAASMGVSSKVLAEGLKAGTTDATKFGNALQDALIKKGKGPLEQMSLSTGNLAQMLKEYIGDLFEDLGPSIKPFLEQVKQLFGIFDSKTKPSGQALKQGIEGFFKKVFEIAAKLVPMVKHFFLQMIIYGLQLYIALKPIVKSFEQWYQRISTNQKVINALHMVMKGLKIAFVSIAIGVGLVLAVFMALQAAVLFGIAQFAALGAIIAVFVTNAFKALADWVGSAAGAAKDFVMGLVNGITNGATQIVNAVTGLATKAKDTFKNALGIHSPSKVGVELGGHFGGGIAGGISDAAPDVHAASKDLGSASFAGASSSAPSSPTGGGKGGGVNVTVEPGAIVINGGSGDSVSELTESAVALMFERVALAQGL